MKRSSLAFTLGGTSSGSNSGRHGAAKRAKKSPLGRLSHTIDAFADPDAPEEEDEQEAYARAAAAAAATAATATATAAAAGVDGGELESAAQRVARLREAGNSLAEDGRFDAALAKWDEAVAAPGGATDAALHELRAQALLALERDFDAVGAAERAVALAPLAAEYKLTLGRALRCFGELEAAAAAMRAALALSREQAVTEEVTAELAETETDIDHSKARLGAIAAAAAAEAAGNALTPEQQAEVRRCKENLGLRAGPEPELGAPPPPDDADY